jgi:hypothetical protein
VSAGTCPEVGLLLAHGWWVVDEQLRDGDERIGGGFGSAAFAGRSVRAGSLCRVRDSSPPD